ncbi:MAG: hypothetical protein HYR55_05450 [Acidobacteria bacterium]|nr:hypothetical protein [Acidobacteriota bacterium]MBI3657810.1 hypothetical protein [Acidobacteriota bacterium]
MDADINVGSSDEIINPIHEIYRIMTAHWQAGTLMAAIRLNVFTHLANGLSTVTELAAQCNAQARWMEKLLIACSALGLVKKIGFHYHNCASAQQYLVKTSPAYQGDLVMHFNELWERFGELAMTVQTGQRGPREMSARNSRSEAEAMEANRTWVRGMHNIAVGGQAVALAEMIDLSGRSRLCDVGGGAGSYSIALCRRYPNLQALVLDVAEITTLADEQIRQADMSSRVRTRSCNFLRDSYGWGHDIILLSGLIHGFGPPEAQLMLRKSFDALVPGGLVLVQELLIDEDKSGPLLPALFSLNMTMGATYTSSEIVGWLKETGFAEPEVRPIHGYTWLDTVIVAKKP